MLSAEQDNFFLSFSISKTLSRLNHFGSLVILEWKANFLLKDPKEICKNPSFHSWDLDMINFLNHRGIQGAQKQKEEKNEKKRSFCLLII